jgi:hypothetical protein
MRGIEENPYKAPGVPHPNRPWWKLTHVELLVIVFAVVLNVLLLLAQVFMCGLAPGGAE